MTLLGLAKQYGEWTDGQDNQGTAGD